MTCEEFQSLPLDERSPEDRLAIKLAKVSHLPALWRDKAKPGYSSPSCGADAPGAAQLLSEPGGATI